MNYGRGVATISFLWHYTYGFHDTRHCRERSGLSTSGAFSEGHTERNAKISNKSSFGSSDTGDSQTNDRIIVMVNTTCLISLGAYRWRSGRQM